MKLQHLILSRFNVNLKQVLARRKRNALTYERWMDQHIHFFECSLLPSMQGQINKNFRWVMFLGDDTPDKYREKIESYGCFESVYIQNEESKCPHTGPLFRKQIADWLKANVQDGYDKTLITRIDVDDCVSFKYVEKTHEAVEREDVVGIMNFGYGYLLDIRDDNERLFLHSRPKFINQFRTHVFERPDEVLQPWLEIGDVRDQPHHVFFAFPCWVHIYHNTNASLYLRSAERPRYLKRTLSGVYLDYSYLKKEFGFDKRYLEEL